MIRDKILKKIDNSANSIGKLPDYKRIKLELVIYAYLVCAFLSLIILGALIHNTTQTILYSVGIALMLLQFINKATLYRKLKFLQQFNG